MQLTNDAVQAVIAELNRLYDDAANKRALYVTARQSNYAAHYMHAWYDSYASAIDRALLSLEDLVDKR